MAKVELSAAAQWNGEGWVLEEIPMWLMVGLGSGAIAYNGENLAIETADGPVSGAPGDYVGVLKSDASLIVASPEDFDENYEVVGG